MGKGTRIFNLNAGMPLSLIERVRDRLKINPNASGVHPVGSGG